MPRPCKHSFEFASKFKFHEELNDFLPADKQNKFFSNPFNGSPSIKDPIEAIGVPHTEVDLIVVNGRSEGFGYRLQNGDSVMVYPAGANITLESIVKLRDKPLRKEAFILDVHLVNSPGCLECWVLIRCMRLIMMIRKLSGEPYRKTALS